MSQYGYNFYFTIGSEVLTLPITPGELSISVGSNNKVINLINEGDINILKSPSLVEIEFDARFPMRKYPYSREPLTFDEYWEKFSGLKTKKTPFIFTVIRTTPNGKGTWATTRRMSLEDISTNESADEGDDVIVSFKLKEYKNYSVLRLKTPNSPSNTTSTSKKPRDDNSSQSSESKDYTVKPGDCLWNIAKKYYGDGSQWTKIYEANKTKINNVARSHGFGDSSNGHWIFPDTVLTIPAK